MKTVSKTIAPAAAIVVSAATALVTYAALVLFHPRCLTDFAEWLARHLLRLVGVFLVVAWLVPEVGAQEAPTEKLPGYSFDSSASLSVSMPQYPGQERSPIIVGAVCVGVAVGVIGYIGVKLLCAALRNHEFIVTNNAACGVCPAESPLPTSPVPDPNASGPQTVTVCAQCSGAPDKAPEGQPLPIRIEHSYDQRNWSTVATGVGVGSVFDLPDTGYWRAVPLFMTISRSDGVTVVHAPPGVLEFSSDLQAWSVVGVNTAETTDVTAEAGFYRVRLN